MLQEVDEVRVMDSQDSIKPELYGFDDFAEFHFVQAGEHIFHSLRALERAHQFAAIQFGSGISQSMIGAVYCAHFGYRQSGNRIPY